MYFDLLTHQLLELFSPKMHFLDILEIFRLDISGSHISFNLVKKASATQQLAFPSTSIIAFYDILAWASLLMGLLAVENLLSVIETGKFYHRVRAVNKL